MPKGFSALIDAPTLKLWSVAPADARGRGTLGRKLGGFLLTRMRRAVSAFGTKRTSLVAPHMSAFGGKADITKRKYPLLQSQLGVKRTWVGALHMCL
jgi:hypothetical protein